jgi:hypothetical protein
MGLIIVMGIASMAIGQQWKVIAQRDKEAELLFRGTRFKNAIERYAADYDVRRGTRTNKYPLTLMQLVEGPKRYLPVVYKDPFLEEEFEVIRINGEIRGIKSRSTETPFDVVHFGKAARYNEIVFQAVEPTLPFCTNAPGQQVPPLMTCQQLPLKPQ